DYTIAPDDTTPAWGDTVTWSIVATGLADGTKVSLYDAGTDEWLGNAVVTDEAATFALLIDPVVVAGMSNPLIVEMWSDKDEPSPTLLATADGVTIPTYGIQPDVTTADEGDSVTWTVIAPDGTYGWSVDDALSTATGTDIGLGST